MLGSSGWYTPKTILDGQKYVRNAIISTTTEPSKDLEGWSEFKDNYKAKYNVLPDRVTALGFDATKLMCSVVAKKGGHNVAEMSRALSETKGYQGFSGLISFDNKRGINTEAVIMKVTSGGFIRVQ